MTLALFDLDNTLLAGDSDHAWGEFLVHKKCVDVEAYRRHNDQFYRDYERGCLDIHSYLAFALEPLARLHPGQLEALRGEFMRDCIEPLILPKAEQLLSEHRARDHTLLIITATNRFITQPIAERLGVDNLLATEPERNTHGYTGKVAGIPCFQQGKVKRLEDWLARKPHPLEEAWFYSDSNNDLPLLEVVGHPVAVDPDSALEQSARARGWPIISLRS